MSTDLFAGIFSTDADAFDSGGDDTPPERDPEPPTRDGGPSCEVCGRDIPWAGRGRRPKRCEDHRRRTGTGPVASKKLAAKTEEDRLQKLAGDLQQGLGELTGGIVPFMPVTAATIASQGPEACIAVVEIAAPYPRFIEGLEKFAQGLPWIKLSKFFAALFLAASVDFGKVEPKGMAANMLGVAEAAERVGWKPRNMPDAVPMPVQGFTTPQPPRFKL